jgi:hypothetical protein
MQNEEFLKMTGKLDIVVYDADGNIKEQHEVPNIVTTAGKTFIASRIAGTASAVMAYMEVGTSTQAAAVGDTALITPVASSRTATSVSGGTASTNTVQYATTFPAGTGTGALTEAGIFNAASTGTMLCRTVFSVINKGASDSMTITWTVTIN